jgi:hypothetical protein
MTGSLSKSSKLQENYTITDIYVLTILLWKCTEVSALAILILFLKATIAATTLWVLVKCWLRVPLPSTTVMESHSQCGACV